MAAILKPFVNNDVVADFTVPKADSGSIIFVSSEIRATNLLTITAGNAVANENVVIGATTYIWKTSPSAANEIDIGSTNAVSGANLIAAINNAAGEGTLYGTGTLLNPDVSAGGGAVVAVVAKRAGVSGNSITVSTTMTNGSWADATNLANGAPTPSGGDREFILTLPQDDVDGGNYEFIFRDNGRSKDQANRDFFTSWTISSGLTKPFVVTGNGRANNPYNSRNLLNTKGASLEGVKLGGRINDGPGGTVVNYSAGESIEFVSWGGVWYSTPPFGSGFYGIGDF